MTVRELVKQYQREIQATTLDADRAAVLLTKLTALLGPCNDEIREADALYAQKLLFCLDDYKSAGKARIAAETSPEFARKAEARDYKELVLELARSLKYFLRSRSEESALTRQG